MPKISAVILTLNEEKNIKRCVESVKDIADDIVIVDSFSTDHTEEICKQYNVRFIHHKFEGHIEQKNWAITQAKYPHILSLDADEALSEELKKSILEVKEKWKYDGYYFNRLTNYCGKWIKYNSWYPSRKLRLWDSRKGKWGGINPHDKFILDKDTTQKYIKGDLFHYSYYTIADHVKQINSFSEIQAHSFFNHQIKPNVFHIIGHPIWRFFRDYIIKLGFLDGFYGFIICINSSHEVFLKYIKLRLLWKEYNKKEKNTICFFNTAKTWGGGEKWHFDISNYLAYKNFDILVGTRKKSHLHQKIIMQKHFNIKIHNLSFLNPFKILRIAKFFKHHNIKTLIVNLPSDLKVASLAAKLAGVDQVIYRRGSAIPIRNSALNRFIFKFLVDEIIANSYETKRTILQNNKRLFNPAKIHVIYNGINLESYDNLNTSLLYERNSNELILGNVGRMVKQKAQKYLIDIAEILKKYNIDFKILIAGSGKLENELKRYAKKKNVQDKIVFLGFQSNIKSIMNSIDIFLLPSLWEGFGYVIIEAMACSKPIIAFNVSSNPEIISNNETGYLIEPFKLNSFVEKILLLNNNKELIKQMGNKGRNKVEEQFEYKKSLEQVLDIINVKPNLDH